MANLDPLIRVRKHALEQKQKFLAELYRQAEQLHGQKHNLLTTLADEQEKLKDMDVQMLSYFGPYSQAVHERVEEIEEAIVKLDARIAVAREDMREAFSDMKKIEITKNVREEAELREETKKENQELDAMGLDAFRRKEE
ncbi:MAG: hypothetical protein L6Q57_03885 [Alphaproteobacteria bacterium]|nr:hypothetical protein [Alphaproteobacteria bacterium]